MRTSFQRHRCSGGRNGEHKSEPHANSGAQPHSESDADSQSHANPGTQPHADTVADAQR